jgi:hypothetical protein
MRMATRPRSLLSIAVLAVALSGGALATARGIDYGGGRMPDGGGRIPHGGGRIPHGGGRIPHGGGRIPHGGGRIPHGGGRIPDRSGLRVVERTAFLGSLGWELSCNPADGTLPRPATVCAAIQRDPSLLQSHPGHWHLCPLGPPAISLSGTWEGELLNAQFSACLGGTEESAQKWAMLLPGGLGVVHIDRGIGLLRLRERESAVVDLLRGSAAAPSTCGSCALRFFAGYYFGTMSATRRAGWRVTFADSRVTAVEGNFSVFRGSGSSLLGVSLPRRLHGWRARTCGSAHQLIHVSAAGVTVLLDARANVGVLVATRLPTCASSIVGAVR